MAISREIFYILMVFASATSVLTDKTARVSLKLFYESDCPDCRLFFEEELGPLIEEDSEGMELIEDLTQLFRVISR